MNLKKQVKSFWNESSCGEDLYLKSFQKEDYNEHSKIRYDLEPEIIEFGEFHKFSNLKTLEIGVGLGSDHLLLAKAGAILSGIDLTERAINHTKRRFELFGFNHNLSVSDAENLPFKENEFDAIYSWGVIHHSADTQNCLDEIYRVLKPGGFAKIMVYHKYSLVGFMLWMRYGLLAFRPFRSLDYIYHNYLESPGTKAFSYSKIKKMLSKFKIVSIHTPLNHGDLLTSNVGQRHRGYFLSFAKKIWPRWFFRKFMKNNGLEMMITLTRPN